MRMRALFFFCLFSLSSLAAQETYHRLQIEPSVAMSMPRLNNMGISLPVGLEVRYRWNFLSLGLKYESALGQFGVDNWAPLLFIDHRTEVATNFDLSTPDLNRMARLNRFQLIGDVHLTVFRTQIRLGGGVALNKFAPYYLPSVLPATVSYYNPPRFLSQIWRVGYQAGPMHVFFSHSSAADQDLFPLSTVGMGYTIGFLRAPHRFPARLWPKEEKPRRLQFRWDIGYSTMVGLTRKHSAGAVAVNSDIMLGLGERWYFGSYLSFLTREKGTDPGTVELFPTLEGFYFQSNVNLLGATEMITVYGARRFPLTASYDALLGLGYGFYQFTGVPSRAGGPEKQNPGGLFLKASVVAGAFSNSIHVHFPGGDLPPFLEFRVGIGLSLFKSPEEE